MSTTSPKLAELIEALPVEVQEAPPPDAALRNLLRKLPYLHLPVGRWNRLWVLGTLQAKIAAAYFVWWLRRGYTRGDKRQETLNETHLKAALKLLGGMSYLRGGVMKVGQVIATHPHAAPQQFADVLGRLHFEAPPMHFSLLREFVRGELGADPEEVFDEFETKAFAAASLGQVHRARLKGTGQRVAVKIQYPNIGRAIRADFRNLFALLTPMRLSADWDNFKAQMEDIRCMLEWETDYEHEAENLRLARSAFTEDEGIVVPRVFEDFSTKRVLTMDYLEGVHLDDFLATNPSQQVRDDFGHKITLTAFRLDWGKSLVYADMQPGNYLFMPDGRLGFIDFGCCVRETPAHVAYLTEAERVYRFAPEAKREVLAKGSDLRPEQAADDERMRAMQEMGDWAWEPLLVNGAFDYSDPEYFRRGVRLYGELVRHRYTRSLPVNTWLFKAIFGMRAMLARLGARVDTGAIMRAESRLGRTAETDN